MLVIREAQMRSLGEEMLRRWIGEYLSSCYPTKIEHIGNIATRHLVDSSLAAARVRGITDPQALRKYSHVTFLLGGGFEGDPACGWALKILNNPRFVDHLSRLRVLEDETVKRLAGEPEGSQVQ